MKLLVVGGSGFLGRNVLRQAPRDWDVHATYREAHDFPKWLEAEGLDHVQPVQVDLRDAKATETAVASVDRPDACLYLAADTRVRLMVEDPALDVRNNIAPVANFTRHYRGGGLVFVSSGAVYMGRKGPVSPDTPLSPTIPYAISKLASERYVRHAHQQGWCDASVVLRFFGAYGPLEAPRKITTKLIQTALAGKEEFTIFGDGKNLIDVMYVDDAVHGLLVAVQNAEGDATLDFCHGSALTLNEFARKVGEAFGHTFRLHHEGASPEYIEFHASPDGMEEAYGVRPTVSLEDGCKRLARWLETSAEGPAEA